MELDPKKQAYWAKHSRGWKASGLSQRDYCNREELSLSSFDRWRRLIREAAAAKAAQATSQKAVPAKLTLVQAHASGEAGMGSEIVLRSPAGWQVTLPPALDREALMQLLSRLR